MGFSLDKHYLKGYTLPEGEVEKIVLETGDPVELVTKQLDVAVKNINRAYGEGVHDMLAAGWIAFGTGVGIGVLQMILKKPVKKGYEKLKTNWESRKEKKQVSKETGA